MEEVKNTKPTEQELIEIIAAVTRNFVQEEAGNKVTNNNMAGFLQIIVQAIQGNISLTAPEQGN